MQQQLSAQKLAFTRIRAVNGAQIDSVHASSFSTALRTHLGAAEIGCLLSHANAWRLIARGHGDHGVVLEDDIHVCNDFGDLIRSVSLDPNEFCVHKLETFGANVTLRRRPSYIARNRRAHKLETHHGGSGAYILSKDVASHLLKYVDSFDEAMDIELFDPNRRTIKNLTIYQWLPAPCIQDFLVREPKRKKSFASNIGFDRSDVRFYSRNRSRKLVEFLRSRLRTLHTKLYSASLLPSGRMRRKIEFA